MQLFRKIINFFKWSNLKVFIANLGENAQFVAFVAHSCLFFIIVCLSGQLQLDIAIFLTALGAVKEYWFDAREEKNPPQTFKMNTQDFIGFVVGSWLPVIFHLHIVRG